MYLAIRHMTAYSYAQPVYLQPHMIRLSPRADTYRRLLERTLTVIPEPDGSSQGLDAHGTLCHLVWFKRKTSSLTIIMKTVLEINDIDPFGFIVHPLECINLPMRYPQAMAQQVQHYMSVGTPSEDVRTYALSVLEQGCHNVVEFALRLCQKINRDCVYEERKAGQPFSAEKVLSCRRGSCRDLAMLYIDAARAVGLAARFVSGYYFDHSPQNPQLHAWAEVFIPGGGWRGYDPTLGLACYGHHIAVASGGSSVEASAVEGNYMGQPNSRMDVKLEYQYLKDLQNPSNIRLP